MHKVKSFDYLDYRKKCEPVRNLKWQPSRNLLCFEHSRPSALSSQGHHIFTQQQSLYDEPSKDSVVSSKLAKDKNNVQLSGLNAFPWTPWLTKSFSIREIIIWGNRFLAHVTFWVGWIGPRRRQFGQILASGPAPVLPGEPVTSCWRCCFVKNNFQYEFNEFIVRVILASHQLNIKSFGERSEICLDNDKCWLIKLIMDSEQSPSSILR